MKLILLATLAYLLDILFWGSIASIFVMTIEWKWTVDVYTTCLLFYTIANGITYSWGSCLDEVIKESNNK